MPGRNDGHQGGVGDLQFANPVGYGQTNEFKLPSDFFGHLPEHRGRRRVSLIGKRTHHLAMVYAPDIPAERNHGPGHRVCHQRLHRLGVEGLLGNLGQPDDTHDPIIKGFPARGSTGYAKVALCEKS